jgi:membrane-bound ClpP family serine protease
MNSERRALVALAFMSVGLLALLAAGVASGWTALNVIGIACLAVAIASQVVILRRPGSAGRRG